MADIYNKENLAGYPETNPPLSNSIDAREPAISAKVHYDDNSRHVNFGERKKWNEAEQSAKDYTNYQFASIIGQFDFADNTKTLSQILKKEIDDRTRILNQEISDRKAAIAQEQNDRNTQITNAINAEASARSKADSNESTTRSNQFTTLINNLNNGSIAPLRTNGVRITMSTSAPSNPVNNGELFINVGDGHMYSFYNNQWNQFFGIYK